MRTVVFLPSSLLASLQLDFFASFSCEFQPWNDCNEAAQTQVNHNHNHNHADFQKNTTQQTHIELANTTRRKPEQGADSWRTVRTRVPCPNFVYMQGTGSTPG
jgi:hypothetical protein